MCTVLGDVPVDQRATGLALLDRTLALQADYTNRLVSAMQEAAVAPIDSLRAKLYSALCESLRGELEGLSVSENVGNSQRRIKCLTDLNSTLTQQAAQTERLGSPTVAGGYSSGNEPQFLGLWYDHKSESFCCGQD